MADYGLWAPLSVGSVFGFLAGDQWGPIGCPKKGTTFGCPPMLTRLHRVYHPFFLEEDTGERVGRLRARSWREHGTGSLVGILGVFFDKMDEPANSVHGSVPVR